MHDIVLTQYIYAYVVGISLWIKNLTTRGSQGADGDCHSFYQTFWPNLGPSSVVDQCTGHGDLYTQIRGEGAAEKKAWAGIQVAVCVFTKHARFGVKRLTLHVL